MRGSSRKFGVRSAQFHIISCVISMRSCCVFDSPRLLHFLFLLSIFSPIVLFFLLAINFIFHDVVDKFPVHFS